MTGHGRTAGQQEMRRRDRGADREGRGGRAAADAVRDRGAGRAAGGAIGQREGPGLGGAG